jgi:surfactin synthase thioesterase subunit
MDDPLYGWRKFVTGTISMVTVPGQHTELFANDSQPHIAEALGRHIDRCAAPRAVAAVPIPA